MAEESDVNYLHYARDINGKQTRVGVVRRNGRRVPRFDPGLADATRDLETSQRTEHRSDSRYYVNLNHIESRTWRLILSGHNVSEIARIEGVTRQAILSRIRGKAGLNGGMISKNFWVLLWWRLRDGGRFGS